MERTITVILAIMVRVCGLIALALGVALGGI
jgi:hypothetical protein